MTKTVTEQVAREKQRAALKMGDSPAKAKRYADEVRTYDAQKKGGKR